MADLTANAYVNIYDLKSEEVEEWVLDNSAAQTIYRGQPMILDVSEDTLYLRGFVTATVVASTDVFIGIAMEPKTVLTTDTETDNKIKVWTGRSKIAFPGSVFTDADAGATMYMSDSATLSATAADNPQIGKLSRVTEGVQVVELSAPQICTGA